MFLTVAITKRFVGCCFRRSLQDSLCLVSMPRTEEAIFPMRHSNCTAQARDKDPMTSGDL
jgi:hypothetical protein